MSVPPPETTEKERLANLLLDAIAFDERITRLGERLKRNLAANPAFHPPTKERLGTIGESRLRVTAPEVLRTPEVLRPMMVARYVAHFTEQELRELVTFYASPLGQKFVRCWSGDDTEMNRDVSEPTAARADELAQRLKKIDTDSE